MFRNIPPVTKNLLIINVIFFLATLVAPRYGIPLVWNLGLHFVGSLSFAPYQLLTYMFVHGGFWHLFFNMFSLWMFGRIIEQAWGPRRFLLYYFVCGLGAGLLQEVFQYFLLMGGDPSGLAPTVGASGAIYGILLAFGMTFPNERIMLLIPPIPMKAKYFVVLFIVLELFSALSDSGGNIAHCAHLGGMLFGWLLILYWRKRGGGRRGGFGGWNTWQPKRPSLWQRLRQRLGHRHEAARQPAGPAFKDRAADYDYNARRNEAEKRVDEILDKIKRSGYESLSEDEKRELFRNSKR